MARVSYETNKQQEKTPMPELDPGARAKCFDEVACGYSAEDAINEARRCIQLITAIYESSRTGRRVDMKDWG